MRYITDRKRVQGLGSGRDGTVHHWRFTVSSVLMVILAPAFVIVLAVGFGQSHADVVSYFSKPFPAIVVCLTLIVGMWHLLQETNEAIEDYVHGVAGKLTLIAVAAYAYTLIAVGLFAIGQMAL
ncbi:MAG: succinate dehydrogenase, hydrophobic membrane anchor protein [Pseudomonadota bacterium]